ncbi:MAG: hypothetical protein FWH07_00435 [Oscillospiraceae bacterium]|nr:hypothetical protein [Oscillospiraceae bacterium]
MREHTKFIYHGYTIEENGFEYHFSMDEYEFRPRWTFALPVKDNHKEDELLHKLVFSLGMVELVSYWKSACPAFVEVKCGSLDDWQINWWKKLYKNGLGEFFYVNNIAPDDDFMTITTPNAHQNDTLPSNRLHCGGLNGCLIPVGGGKDSIVTLELLKSRNEPDCENAHDCCYIVGDIKRAYDSAKTAGYPDSRIITVERTIDPTLLQLNKKGYLNGHTPFSAVIAFSSLLFAYLTGKEYVVLSNESSANEGNVGGADINHQYSKSTEFERDFREYVGKMGRGLPNYFSLLRPWNELQITRKFTQFPQYFPVFQSCNAGTKSNTWCCKCAKCLYVYIMLATFLDDNALISIFGENLLNNQELAALLAALIDPQQDKPFECVGTRDEVNCALFAAIKRREPDLPILLRRFKGGTIPSCSDLMGFFDSDNFVPDKFLKIFSKNF